MDFEKLIVRCEDAMKEKNLTNKDVARMSNVSEATVSRTLTGRGQNASAATLIAICDALNVPAEAEGQEAEQLRTALERVYQARVADLKLVIANKERWVRTLFIVSLFLMAFILTVFMIDILNPNVGWFRSALGIDLRFVRS